jgi:hypothetical protein
VATGGKQPTGGAPVGGVTVATGGSGGGTSRSSSSTLGSNDEVTISSGKAQGLMTGWAWIDMGRDDVLTNPTCNGAPITSAALCATDFRWSKPDALCVDGLIPALPAVPSQSDYGNNWGMRVGVNAFDPVVSIGTNLTSFVSVAFTFSGSPATGVRAFFHRKGDPADTTYCMDAVKSGEAMPLTKFNTKCSGDAATIYLTLTDLARIDSVALGISSTTSAITVRDFCLERISFSR